MSQDISSVNASLAQTVGTTAAPQSSRDVVTAAAQKARVEVQQPKEVAPKIDPAEMLERLEQIVERLNDSLQDLGRDLNFSVDDRINRYVIVVQNKESGEVIRQIPDVEALRMAHRIEDLKGVIFSEDV
jgi:Uncharacterized flagellar protein FlaG